MAMMFLRGFGHDLPNNIHRRLLHRELCSLLCEGFEMSLAYLMKDIAQTEMGLLYKYSRNYLYIFVQESEVEKHYEKLHKQMKHWRFEKIKESFKPKTDDNGKQCMITYKESMPCLLPTNREKYPIIKEICLIPKSTCNKCVHRKRFRNRPYCELLRAKNKGMLMDLLNKAAQTTKEIIGG
jgi:hypothetical protein